MRLRALPLLLVLTGGDYALWTWSIADGHDIVSLVSGLTLLPLLAATLALLAVGVARLLTFILKRPAAPPARAQRPAARPLSSAPPAEPAAREQASRRLAA